jgi:ribose-phosphate pyrophosphokinase
MDKGINKGGGQKVTYQLKNGFKLFTLNSNKELANEMANLLGCELGHCSVSQFSDGEIQIHIEESVRGADVFVVQPTCAPANDNIMELLILMDAFFNTDTYLAILEILYISFSYSNSQVIGYFLSQLPVRIPTENL